MGIRLAQSISTGAFAVYFGTYGLIATKGAFEFALYYALFAIFTGMSTLFWHVFWIQRETLEQRRPQ